MNAVLKKLKFPENPTFKQIFNKELCQKVLLDYWDELISGKNHFLFDMESSPTKTLEAIFKDNPHISPKEALYLVGLRVMSKEGIRTTRAIVERYATTRTWYRMKEDLKLLDKISGKTTHEWVQQIKDELERFTTYKLINTKT
jgi:hypothetical protein